MFMIYLQIDLKLKLLFFFYHSSAYPVLLVQIKTSHGPSSSSLKPASSSQPLVSKSSRAAGCQDPRMPEARAPRARRHRS
jgi:hypothetical protein